MVRHIVMWRTVGDSPEARAAAAGEIRSLLEPLPGLVPGIGEFEVGVNALPGSNASDVVLTVTFDGWNALRDYGIHPEHVKVAERIRELTIERRSVDHELF
jgi:hypothetical protein